jgi:hypothetical protein
VNTFVNQQVPQGYTPQQTAGAFNQRMAQAHAEADMRYNTKPLDKAGVSRGAGQAGQAGIASAQNLAKGIAEAYGQQLGDAQTNAQMQLRGNASRETLGQDVSQLAAQNQYADALAALQRQQTMGSGVLGGLLGSGGLTNFLGY